VTIARALASQPAIIWADEPTGNLDTKSATDVLTLMRDLNREQGQTFVIVTHDPHIGDLCDRVIIGLGTAAGILMGQAIIGELFSVVTAGRTLAVPWSQIGIIVLGAYLFSLLTTILPAIQASRIYPADALRYE
jgi:ABC-type uncharacterized transport system ATPase subunit